MATPQASPQLPILERNDVHKSAKCLETIVNALGEYSQLATLLAAVQKRLAKALREAAANRATSDTPANAMAASANIFEALGDVDAKFARILEKEYEGISSEIRKWFKKLAKEEKAHDEMAASANAKLKQAAQTYEKKAKKNVRDAGDDHNRYMNLLSSLGADVAHAKSAHTIFVSQHHTTSIFSVGSCLSRLADGEWVRSCEAVKKCAPAIGKVGEWRAFCEGVWSGNKPGDLVDLNAIEPRAQRVQEGETLEEVVQSLQMSLGPGSREPSDIESPHLSVPPPAAYGRRSESPMPMESPAFASAQLPSPQRQRARTPESPSVADSPRLQTRSPNISAGRRPTTAEDDSYFPPSPSRDRAPLPRSRAHTPLDSPELSTNHPPDPPPQDIDSTPEIPQRVIEEPRSLVNNPLTRPANPSTLSDQYPPGQGSRGTTTTDQSTTSERPSVASFQSSDFDSKSDLPTTKTNGREADLAAALPLSKSRDIEPIKELGSSSPTKGGVINTPETQPTAKPLKTPQRPASSPVTRSESTRSHVAAMRDKYAMAKKEPVRKIDAPISSSPPRDLPRLSNSVTHLATRYAPVESPTGNGRDRERERGGDRDRERERDRNREQDSTRYEDRVQGMTARERELQERMRALEKRERELAKKERSHTTREGEWSDPPRGDFLEHRPNNSAYSSPRSYSPTSPTTARPRYAAPPSSYSPINSSLLALPPIQPLNLNANASAKKDGQRTWMGKGLRRLSMPIGAAFSSVSSSSTDFSRNALGGRSGNSSATDLALRMPEMDVSSRRRSFEGRPKVGFSDYPVSATTVGRR
ncbi:hypothetical protein BOTBODRAFT_173603 [Botryobasidium botryosum FD-172 SS1]|uniref:IMD domain-containing protein n=1 Tax=Botryobasidium botryosum (strain FD-172 SS1) TaxID=930990 RepID=A0A067MJK2_BOTB1|nr:hypothetical protein BOTBODRAFT_173603 [Botryobasidium botryosum FD-172 SS1]